MKRLWIGKAAFTFACAVIVPMVGSAATFVSSTGSDLNTCTQSAPCRTFAGAMAHTLLNGTIFALDSGDFGMGTKLNISFPVTIDGGAHGAFYTGPDGDAAFNINMLNSPTLTTIRNISIVTGAGASAYGVIGIITNSAIALENITVTSYDSNANAIALKLDSLSRASLTSITMTGGNFGLDLFTANPAGPPFTASLDRVIATGFNSIGLLIQGGNVTVRNSIFRDSADGAVLAAPTPAANVLFENTQFANNSLTGVVPVNGYTMRLSNCVFSGNTTAINGAGTVISYRNNTFAGNGTDGTISLSTSLK